MNIPKIVEIMHAWKIAAKPTPEQQKIAEARAVVCDECEFKEFVTLIRTYKCSECGCPISKKIYSPERGPNVCPKGKWPE